MDFTGPLSNTATVVPPSAVNDLMPSNNTATDTDHARPTLTLRKIRVGSVGSVGSFGFGGSNGLTAQTQTTATAGGSAIVSTSANTLQQTDLQVVKTASPDPVVTGDVVTYQIVVSNNGPLDANNVILSDVAGAGQDGTAPSTTATCTATGGASCPSTTVAVASLLGVVVVLPSLPVGGQVTVQLQCPVLRHDVE